MFRVYAGAIVAGMADAHPGRYWAERLLPDEPMSLFGRSTPVWQPDVDLPVSVRPNEPGPLDAADYFFLSATVRAFHPISTLGGNSLASDW